jgi:energy-converting hydrogenase Eha subunit G
MKNECHVGVKYQKKQNDFVSDFQGIIHTEAFNWTNWIRCMIHMFTGPYQTLNSDLKASHDVLVFFTPREVFLALVQRMKGKTTSKLEE